MHQWALYSANRCWSLAPPPAAAGPCKAPATNRKTTSTAARQPLERARSAMPAPQHRPKANASTKPRPMAPQGRLGQVEGLHRYLPSLRSSETQNPRLMNPQKLQHAHISPLQEIETIYIYYIYTYTWASWEPSFQLPDPVTSFFWGQVISHWGSGSYDHHQGISFEITIVIDQPLTIVL